jgi:hypothetical protein
MDSDDFISLVICDSASTVQYEFDDVATRVKFEEISNYLLLPVLSVALLLTVKGELIRK